MSDAPDPVSQALKEVPPPAPEVEDDSDCPPLHMPPAPASNEASVTASGSEMVQSLPLQEVADGWDKAIQDLNKKKKRDSPTTAAAAVSNTNSSSAGSGGIVVPQEMEASKMSDAQLMALFQQQELQRQQRRAEKMRGNDVAKTHKFWNTQPVVPMSDEVKDENGPIEGPRDDVRQEPFNMPAGFEWCDFDINDPDMAKQVYDLLNMNYVEDDDHTFRFDYSVDFLRWALLQPGYLKEWHVGVRNSKTKALMGMITAVPVAIRVYDKIVDMAEINFLCVHKKLRDKRLAPVLIKEITRRVNLTNRWQAVYTAGVVLPKPVARCRYHHRSLNPKKLIETKFSSLPPKTSMSAHLKKLKLPLRPSNPAMRAMREEDVPAVHRLLSEYLQQKTHLCQFFSVEDVAHCLLPRAGVISSFVVETDDHQITDFASFYYLNSSVLNHPEHKTLFAAYSFYNVPGSMKLIDLMRDLLVFARNEGADVFNALDLAENEQFLAELEFGRGDGFLQYYVYNWKCPGMEPAGVGLVLT